MRTSLVVAAFRVSLPWPPPGWAADIFPMRGRKKSAAGLSLLPDGARGGIDIA